VGIEEGGAGSGGHRGAPHRRHAEIRFARNRFMVGVSLLANPWLRPCVTGDKLKRYPLTTTIKQCAECKVLRN